THFSGDCQRPRPERAPSIIWRRQRGSTVRDRDRADVVMKILVTGVAGFIGSNLTENLLARGHQVIGVDNMSQGEPLNMAAFEKNPHFRFHKVDICDPAALRATADGAEAIV